MTFDPKLTFATALAIGICADAAGAENGATALRGRFEISGNLALVSDYRGRGLTISDHDAAVQAGIEVAHKSGLSAGMSVVDGVGSMLSD